MPYDYTEPKVMNVDCVPTFVHVNFLPAWTALEVILSGTIHTICVRPTQGSLTWFMDNVCSSNTRLLVHDLWYHTQYVLVQHKAPYTWFMVPKVHGHTKHFGSTNQHLSIEWKSALWKIEDESTATFAHAQHSAGVFSPNPSLLPRPRLYSLGMRSGNV